MILLYSVVICNSSHTKFEELISRKIRELLLTKEEFRRLEIRLKADNALFLWDSHLAELYRVVVFKVEIFDFNQGREGQT